MCGARLPAEEQSGLRPWLALVVWPGAAGRLAVGAGTLASLMAGMIAFGCGVGLVFSAKVVPTGEPFQDMSEYVLTAATAAAIVAAGLSTIGGLVVVLPVWLALRHAARRGRSALAASVRAIFLTAVSFVLPVAMWWMCALLKYAQDPGFGFYTAAVKPVWVHSMFFTIAGFDFWILLMMLTLLAAAVLCAESARTIAGDLAAGHCRRCGYDLSGLPTLVCPECGDTAPPPPKTTHGVGTSTSAP